MITLSEVEEIHKTLIETFGGANGTRDVFALESAIGRPYQTFDNTELHPTALHKAAALIESILINHPFIDGNKRTGYVLARILLIENGFDIRASQEEKYKWVISIASGQIKFEEIIEWLNRHTVRL